MSNSSIIGLINNAALLLALCLLYDMLGFSLQKRKNLLQEIISGVVLGVIGLTIMSNPWTFGQGVIFDTRSVLLVVSGFFFGTIPVAVVMLFTGVFRFLSGGAGMLTGLGVILTSGLIGLLWRQLRPPIHEKPSSGELYLLGVAVHLAMLAWFFLLPWPLAIDVLGKISLPVMLIYPVAVMILSKLLVMSGQRRQTERDLIKSEERYRELVESANSIILRRDREGRITFFNEFAQRFFGYSAEEVLGKNVVGTIVPETDSAGRDLDKMIREITLRPQDYMTNENENILRNGRRVRITWTNKPIVDASGEVAEILCIGNDVTKQRLAEEATREVTLKMQEVVRAANVGLWEWDLVTNETRFSAEWKRQIGYEEQEIVDSFAEWESRVHPDDLAPTLARIRAAIEAKEPQYQVEFRFRHRDGFYRWIMASSSVIVDYNGEAIRVMGSHIDITERRQWEDTLKESERKYRDLFEANRDAITIFRINSNNTPSTFLDMNKAAVLLGGYSKEELLAMTPLEFENDISDVIIKRRLEEIEAKGYAQFETILIDKKKNQIPVEIQVGKILYDGSPALMNIAKDIRERKRAELLLRESEERFRGVFETSSVGMVIVETGSQRFLKANQSFLDILGYSEEELLVKRVGDITHPDDWLSEQKLIEEKIQNPAQKYIVEKRYQRKDGNIRWVEVTADYLCPHVSDILVIANVLDITERKLAEAKIRQNEARLKLLVDILQQPFETIQELLDYALDQALQLTESQIGYIYHYHEERKEFVLNSWSKEVLPACTVINPQTCFELKKAGIWGEAVRQRQSIIDNDFQTAHPLKKGYPEGHVQLFKFMTIPIFNGENIVSVVGLANKETDYDQTDILQISLLMDSVWKVIESIQAEDEHKKLNIQLQQAQKMEAIGTLAGGIAHDFNNILGAILGYAEMVQEDCPPGSIMRSSIDRVVEASHRAKELVKQILAFSRQAESDKIVLQPALIIKEAMKMLRASLPKTIDIQQNIDPEAGLILADPTQIHQIITNLCTNAFHAMEEIGGTLKVSLKNKVLTPDDLVSEPHVKPGQFVEISVGDTGPGIVPGIMDKIFDPFFTTKEVGKGTGMGLATIHGIAKKSGGFVSCKSSLGKGTTFYVYLPVQAVTAPPEAETTPLELVQSGIEHILFIDDEEMLAAMGKTMLERLGYRVTVETNSIEALKIIQSQPDAFDLVITDQTMPGMTGSDLARRILQIRPGLPIILCTGFSNQISEEKARIYGIKGFAMKPLTKKDLAVLIRKALDGE